MADAKIRIDKWMWFARVVKTRTLAQKLVKGGKVRVDRQKATSPSQAVSVGNVLTITLERRILVYEILELGERRGPFKDAQNLYRDLSPPPAPKQAGETGVNAKGYADSGRPDKRQRRQLRALKTGYLVDDPHE